jgi:KTSC domain-containing protein
MDRLPVSSSNLASVGYDDAGQVLEVEFRHGGVYQYTGVSAAVFGEFLAADSLGGYLARSIKPRYPFRRVD